MGEEDGKIFVGGVSPNTTEDDFKNHFLKYGEVVDCVLMKEPTTGKPRGFGFVTYKDPSCVDLVLAESTHILNSKVIDPKRCTPRAPGAGKGGPPGGGRGGPRSNTNKIFIGGVGQATEEEISEVLSQFGKVVQVQLMMDKVTNKCRGFGFVTFDTEEAVNKLCHQHFVTIQGKTAECKRAETRAPSYGGPPGQGGPGGWGGGDMNQQGGPPMGGGPGGYNPEQGGWGGQQQQYGAGPPGAYNQYNSFGNYGGRPPAPGQNGQYGGYNQGGQQGGYGQQPQQQGGYGYGGQGQQPQNNFGGAPQQNYGGYGQPGYGQQGGQANYGNQPGGPQGPNQPYGQQQNYGPPGAPGTQGNMGNYPQEASGYGPQRVNYNNQAGYNPPGQQAAGGNYGGPNMNPGGYQAPPNQQPPQQQPQAGNYGGPPNQQYGGGNNMDPQGANYNRQGGPQPFHPYRR